MSRVRSSVSGLVVLAAPPAAETTVEPSAGGSPGAYLDRPGTFTSGPLVRATGASAFTGDGRAERVESIGVDLITIDLALTAVGRPLSPILFSDNRTPGDFSDDWAACTPGPNVPLPGEG